MSTNIRAIAFYLPQFHPITENDEWWGKGFTEWRNVTQAKPLFPGHYQPHLPADLGFYDLRLAETREAQADLAREYGIHGFCYYHYWFNGRRILERPFNEVLSSGKPDFPFCLCWANENWTRRWDGEDQQILLRQEYNANDDRQHIESLIQAFSDARYIRLDGRPLFLVYRAEYLPDAHRTTDIWRETSIKAGVGEPYLVRVLSGESFAEGKEPKELGFDAETAFAPFSWPLGGVKFRRSIHRYLMHAGLLSPAFTDHKVVDYDTMVSGMEGVREPRWKRFSCVTPSWDNSARKKKYGHVFHGSTPEKYGAWLRRQVYRTMRQFEGDEQIIFINAWNEWAEGNHLEPDLHWGSAYLQATRNALETGVKKVAREVDDLSVPSGKIPGRFRQIYWKGRASLENIFDVIRYLSIRWF